MRLARLLARVGFVAGGFALGLYALSVAPGRAHAFSEPRSYPDNPAYGGGGGRWFTGSPADGYGCSECHSGAPAPHLLVEGIPGAGYVPGATYDIRLSWPEFAKTAHDSRVTPVMGVSPPSMGLVAELVAETGFGAGTIEISDAATAAPGELCEIPPGVAAAQLYSVRPGKQTAQVGKCEANALGQRCLLAVLACGAQELRFRWTASSQWQGAVWFSAGFVATEHLSGSPLTDGVTEVSRVIVPAASQTRQYETKLHNGGCAASPFAPKPGGRTLGADAAFSGMSAALCVLRARRRGRRVVGAQS